MSIPNPPFRDPIYPTSKDILLGRMHINWALYFDQIKRGTAVTYDEGATNSTVRTLHDKLQDQSISIKDFGAISGQDATTAIQRTIDRAYATARSVFIPHGNWPVSASLIIYSNTLLWGAGYNSHIYDNTGNLQIIVGNDVSDIEIYGIRFTGMGDLGTAGRGVIWLTAAATYGAKRARIHNCYVKSPGTCGITLGTSDHCQIYDNLIYDTREHGIYIAASNNNIVSGNLILDAGQQGISGNICGIKISENSSFNVVSENQISNAKHEGILLSDGHKNNISGNVIYNANQSGIRAATLSTAPNRNNISSNYIYGSGAYCIRCDELEYSNISGNYLYQTNNSPALYLATSDSKKNNISGNYLSTSNGGAMQAILDYGTANNYTGNFIDENWDYGIRFTSTSSSCCANGNRIFAAVQPYTDEGINNYIFENNQFMGSAGDVAAIKAHLSASDTWNPGTIADGDVASKTLAVSGAEPGDTVAVGFSVDIGINAIISGSIGGDGAVRINIANFSGVNLELAPGTVRADVWKHSGAVVSPSQSPSPSPSQSSSISSSESASVSPSASLSESPSTSPSPSASESPSVSPSP